MVIVMRTTIAVDDDLMEELMRVESGVSRSEAVRRALREYLRQRRVDEFMTLAGSRLVDLDWREAERQELDKVHQIRTKRQRDGRRR